MLAGKACVGLAALQRLKAVVHLEADLDELGPERTGPEDRHEKGNPEDEVRRNALDVPGIDAGVERHLRVFLQVAQASVDHAGGSPGPAPPELALLDEYDPHAAQGEVARDPRAVDPASDDEDL